MDDFNRALALSGAALLTIGILLTGFLMVGTAAAESTFDDELDLEDGDTLVVNTSFAEDGTADLEATIENEDGDELDDLEDELEADANESDEWTYDFDADEYDDIGSNDTATAFVTVTADEDVVDEYAIIVAEDDDDGTDAPSIPISSDDTGYIVGGVLLIFAIGLLVANSGNGGSRRY
ncbi:hypothetical protein [Natrarchaeobaculum aegyptiacum]|uniref:Uncharacterized protein n=1 Tax=Natrarchaeobaculum aegyptiacum TaxID=745377 RepID=A0A2Z2HS75_9EURY|nr:hypothetical protein [Natrarchaeobaculum aegyptiacum]ARS89643.1 hypothetical protein B1756_07765 [Natrarchaeobaculum aegyptiacum]